MRICPFENVVYKMYSGLRLNQPSQFSAEIVSEIVPTLAGIKKYAKKNNLAVILFPSKYLPNEVNVSSKNLKSGDIYISTISRDFGQKSKAEFLKEIYLAVEWAVPDYLKSPKTKDGLTRWVRKKLTQKFLNQK